MGPMPTLAGLGLDMTPQVPASSTARGFLWALRRVRTMGAGTVVPRYQTQEHPRGWGGDMTKDISHATCWQHVGRIPRHQPMLLLSRTPPPALHGWP